MSDITPDNPHNLLDRPLLAKHRLSWETVLLALLVVFVVATRLWDLGSRGYEHDESIHAWESWKLATGQGYVHDPPYHGPFLYHLIAFVYLLFGDSDYTARLGPALFGIVLALLPWTLRRWLGRKGALMSMLLMAISPVVMCRSRFVWHDVPGTVVNLLLLLAVVRYLTERKNRDLYMAAGVLTVGLCVKATTYITCAIFGTFLAALFLWQWLHDRKRPWRSFAAFDLIMLLGTLILPTAAAFPIKWLGHDPVAYDQSAILFSGGVFLAVLAVAVALGLWWDSKRWPVCAAIFWAIYLPLYTTFFTNLQGFGTGTVGMLGYWLVQQGVRRGDQPWFYYLVLLGLYEFLPIIASVGAVVAYICRGDPRARHATPGAQASSPAPDTYPRPAADDGVPSSSPATDAYPRPAADDGAPASSPAPDAYPHRAADVGAPGFHPAPVPFVPLLIYWCVGVLLIYSWAGEKMPWLTLHLALPLHLLAGWGLGRLLEADWRRIRQLKGLWLLGLVPLAAYSLVRAVLTRPAVGVAMDPARWLAWGAALVVLALSVGIATVVLRRVGGKNGLRMTCLSCVAVLLGLTLRFAWMATFANADYATEFLVYAAGTPDTGRASREIKQLSQRLYGDLSIRVVYDNEAWWPFCWYLRDMTNTFTFVGQPKEALTADVWILNYKDEAATKPYMLGEYDRRQYRMLWWPNEDWYRPMTLASLWADLQDPVARRALWNVVFYRVHGQPTTAWYNGSSFGLYLRKGLAEQLWGLSTPASVVR